MLLAVTLHAFVVQAENSQSSQLKNAGNITYIDIGIQQPNVEDCLSVFVPDLGTDSEWINVFPNPNPGKFTLEVWLRDPGKTLTIQMYDLAGKIVFERKEKSEGKHFQKEVNVGDLQKGVYFIRITGNEKIGVKQIIVK